MLADGHRLLDVACGNGASLRAIRARWAVTARGLDASPGLAKEFLEAVTAQPPAWIVVGAIDGARVSLERRLATLPPLAALIASHYCTESVTGEYVLFRYCREL